MRGCPSTTKSSDELTSKAERISKQLSIRYRLLDALQSPFAYVFWFIEQRKGWLQHLLANEGRQQ